MMRSQEYPTHIIEKAHEIRRRNRAERAERIKAKKPAVGEWQRNIKIVGAM